MHGFALVRSGVLSGVISLAYLQAASLDRGPVETAQSLFDAMSSHNADAARELFTAEATMTAVHEDGKAVVGPAEKWVARLGASQDKWLERMWKPQVLEHGSIAVVWAPYDFHLNGKFSHCGIDSFNLVKSATGWKISGVAYTSEVKSCSPSPLGPPEPTK